MNAKRRNALRVVIGHLEMIETLRKEAYDILSDVLDGEEDALASLPAGLAESAQADQMAGYIENMDGVLTDLDMLDCDTMREELLEIIEA